MGLTPDDRVLLGDLLAPPSGYNFDQAIATTFSLDLIALLTAPMSLAAADYDGTFDRVDPVQLLESVRRYAGRITTFVQGGRIRVPAEYRPILTFLEDRIVQVSAPKRGGVFHPKLWALRFRNAAGTYLHRCLILSRNLTFDRSWDTAVRLDETPDGEVSPTAILELLRRLPKLALPGQNPHQSVVTDLVASLRKASFAVPDGYRNAELAVWGLGRRTPAQPMIARALVVSPFIDQRSLDSLVESTRWDDPVRVVSRADTLDRLKLSSKVAAYVLNETDSLPTGDDDTPQRQQAYELATLTTTDLTGLHAKVVVRESDQRAYVQFGSANLTGAARNANVELVATLTTSKWNAGIDPTWGDDTSPGLHTIVTPYVPNPDRKPDRKEADRRVLEQWHAKIVGVPLELTARLETAEQYTVQGNWPIPSAPDGVTTTVAPLSRPAAELPAATDLRWEDIPGDKLTPYLILTSTLSGTALRSLHVATLSGIPDRRAAVYEEMLSDPNALLRFLALLLANPADPMSALLDLSPDSVSANGATWQSSDTSVVLFEPLMRAAAEGSTSVDRFISGVGELLACNNLPDAQSILHEVQTLYGFAQQLRPADSQARL